MARLRMISCPQMTLIVANLYGKLRLRPPNLQMSQMVSQITLPKYPLSYLL
jgi:hypothetical protein